MKRRIIAEINQSCTPEQARACRKTFEENGWVEGIDFIDHTEGGTKCFPKEEMEQFRRGLAEGSGYLAEPGEEG